MSLLEDIHEAAVNGDSDLSTLLRKCKVLASRLGSKPLEDWLIWESNGYPNHVNVPEYRMWPLAIKGHFSGPLGSGLRNVTVPMRFIPKEVRPSYQSYKCRQSISLVEKALQKTDDKSLRVPTGDLVVALGTNVYNGMNCLQVWAEFSPSHFVELLNSVRNRILDFALAVWKENPKAGDVDGKPTSIIESSKVTQIFNFTIHGGNTSLVGLAADSPITINIMERNFDYLKQILLEKGVREIDLDGLKNALDQEPTVDSPEGFGPKVSSWIANMVGKAAMGTWEIGVGAAGALLAQAISKYYGF
ncbi:MAG: hypothetical protein KKC30_12650 [Proteobacteria bacterium]|nr:hypothetical protein [Pseudomonadota bacterium]MBU4384556.1 hypothetical protein [Pseudomonadota bacterium]MBU4604905.1 hypothetical protein [Pseudomonadota bacterium]MCG2766296.1 hypothetical protein [Desulfarculaceae bacterium]